MVTDTGICSGSGRRQLGSLKLVTANKEKVEQSESMESSFGTCDGCSDLPRLNVEPISLGLSRQIFPLPSPSKMM